MTHSPRRPRLSGGAAFAPVGAKNELEVTNDRQHEGVL